MINSTKSGTSALDRAEAVLIDLRAKVAARARMDPPPEPGEENGATLRCGCRVMVFPGHAVGFCRHHKHLFDAAARRTMSIQEIMLRLIREDIAQVPNPGFLPTQS